ncbi:MAG: hypothetical protein EA397_01210 [Deltaproteobacteria bacterium]|nr:MAG: hypothetical protein EA397_01210 [Deltaproteobacteria bacterium]
MKALLTLSGAAVVTMSLCCGMCSRAPAPVEARYDGPGRVHAGQMFPFTMRLTNNTRAPVTIESVVVPASLARNLQLVVENAQRKEPFGDGLRAWIPPVTIAPGAEERVADFSGVPFVSGAAGGRLEFCEPSGTCHRGAVGAIVLGGVDRAMRQTWELPESIVLDEPFEIALTIENVSGGPDRLTSAGVHQNVTQWLDIAPLDPKARDKGRNLGRETWLYNLDLDPSESTRITFAATATSRGEQTFTGAICPTSETFCVDEKVSVRIQ